VQLYPEAGLEGLGGPGLAGHGVLPLSTGGPAIVDSMPYDGQPYIDENQIFVLGLDAVPNEASVAANAYCRADGINEKSPCGNSRARSWSKSWPCARTSSTAT
jgi:hypothetical protein